MVMTTAQALIKFLNNQYVSFDGNEHPLVKGIFTLFGHGNVLGLGQALEEDPGSLDVYQGKNEQGMAHAAMAYAKQKRRKQIFAVTASVGPGSANMITAAATATANQIPLLLLPGDVYATRQPDPVLQQIEQTYDLSISTNDAFRSVSKYFDRITRPEQLMSAMLSAVRVLTCAADTGAVTIALPQDVQGESYDFPESFFKRRVHRIERTKPTDDMLDDAVAAIMSAKKPLIICGGGVQYSEAGDALAQFCSDFNIPFGETQAGKGAVVYDNPHNMGGVGATGGLAANILAKESDLIIGVGTRFTDFTTCSKWLFQNPQVGFLNINLSDFHAGKLDGIKVVADVKAALTALSIRLKEADYAACYTDEYHNAKAEWNKEIQRLFHIDGSDTDFVPEIKGHLDHKINEYKDTLHTTLTQTEVLGKLQELLDVDSVVVGSSGSLPGCLQRIWLPKSPNTYHVEYGYSCMGYEICGALGVKLACPDAEVYSMVGDGSFLMLHSELFTSLQMGKKINILLFDNAGFGCINNLQMSKGMGSFGTEFRKNNLSDDALMTIDFAKIAEGYGAKSYTVHTLAQLTEAIEDSKKQPYTTLIDIKVLPKTMTDGYESWWNCGVSSTAKKESIQAAYAENKSNLNNARKY